MSVRLHLIYIMLLLIISVQLIYAGDNAGSIPMTPVKNVELFPQQVTIPDKYKSVINNISVNLPKGFKAQVFYAGNLGAPRMFAWGPDSVLYITDMGNGNIIALPDKNHDRIADTAIIVASGIFANSIEFYKGALYAAETGRVWKLSDKNNDGFYETKEVFIDNVGGGSLGGHSTRTIVFDSVKKKLYLSIGSSCNVCRDVTRADIEEYNDDGSGRRIYASGIRNAVGMTIQPSTGKLWADNNGSDLQGDNIPPEWIDIIRDGGFYGFPYAYAYKMYFDFNISDYRSLLPITPQDTQKVNSMVKPAALIQSHSAPMAIKFSNQTLPEGFRNGAFVALHGSWNRTIATGYKVVYLQFANPTDTVAEYVTDFATGFMTDSVNRRYWARPVGLEVDHSGNLYIGSDNQLKFVMVVYQDTESNINNTGSLQIDEPDINVFPNPTAGIARVIVTIPAYSYPVTPMLKIYNALGEIINTVDISQPGNNIIDKNIDLNGLSEGMYYIRLIVGDKVITKPVVLLK